MASSPYKAIEKNIDVITLVDKRHPVKNSGYTTIEEVPLNVREKLTIPKGNYKGNLDADGTLYINNGYFGELSYRPSEYVRNTSDKRSMVQKIWTKNKNLIMIIGALGVGYFAYKKFIKK